MRIFREAGMTNAVRGETQVWTVETESQAEALSVWYDIQNSTCCDFLHWNDGSDKFGVCFVIDRDDVAKMKRIAKESRKEFRNR